jgi:hypothetical protein
LVLRIFVARMRSRRLKFTKTLAAKHRKPQKVVAASSASLTEADDKSIADLDMGKSTEDNDKASKELNSSVTTEIKKYGSG